MKAAVLTKINAPLEVKEIERGSELLWGRVLVKLTCAGICGAQLQEIDGQKGNPAHLPHLLGHEGCGIVQDIGPLVQHVKTGDKVVLHWRKGEGMDPTPSVLYYGGIKAGPITTFSEYTIANENRVTSIPHVVPDELGALLGCALSTALATIENVAKVRFGESVLVAGCGGVGLAMILAAKLASPQFVIGTDKADKFEFVKSVGGDFVYDVADSFDVIIDTTGTANWLECLAPSGRYVLVGQPTPASSLVFSNPIHLFNGEGKIFQATQGGGFNPTRDIPRYVNLWRSGALDNWPKLISHHFSLDDINEGITLMREGKTARVMIKML